MDLWVNVFYWHVAFKTQIIVHLHQQVIWKVWNTICVIKMSICEHTVGIGYEIQNHHYGNLHFLLIS